MGGGQLDVMDESTCMVDVARRFSHHLASTCPVDCRTCCEELGELCRILDRICGGESHDDDLARLETLAARISEISLCGLGRCPPNPLLSTLRYFGDEYEEHVYRKACQAGVCEALAPAAA
jgi:NADH-quinone oxidoreductase subunit F